MTMSSPTGELAAPGNSAPQPNATLIGLSRAELAARLARLGVPERQTRMRVRQLWSWLYVRGRDRLRRHDRHRQGASRASLAASFTLGAAGDRDRAGLRRRHAQMAARASRDGKEIETVYIPEEDRGTLCISSQVGCTLTCTLLPYRHAAAGAQPHRGRDRRPDHAGARPDRRLAGRDAPRTRAGCPMPSARSPMSC